MKKQKKGTKEMKKLSKEEELEKRLEIAILDVEMSRTYLLNKANEWYSHIEYLINNEKRLQSLLDQKNAKTASSSALRSSSFLADYANEYESLLDCIEDNVYEIVSEHKDADVNVLINKLKDGIHRLRVEYTPLPF